MMFIHAPQQPGARDRGAEPDHASLLPASATHEEFIGRLGLINYISYNIIFSLFAILLEALRVNSHVARALATLEPSKLSGVKVCPNKRSKGCVIAFSVQATFDQV